MNKYNFHTFFWPSSEVSSLIRFAFDSQSGTCEKIVEVTEMNVGSNVSEKLKEGGDQTVDSQGLVARKADAHSSSRKVVKGASSEISLYSSLLYKMSKQLDNKCSEQIDGFRSELNRTFIVMDAIGVFEGHELETVGVMSQIGFKDIRLVDFNRLLKHMFRKGIFGKDQQLLLADTLSHSSSIVESRELKKVKYDFSQVGLEGTIRATLLAQLHRRMSRANGLDWFEVSTRSLGRSVIVDKVQIDNSVKPFLNSFIESLNPNMDPIIGVVGAHSDYVSSSICLKNKSLKVNSYNRAEFARRYFEHSIFELPLNNVEGELVLAIDDQKVGVLKYSSAEANKSEINHLLRLFGQGTSSLCLKVLNSDERCISEVEMEFRVNGVVDVANVTILVSIDEFFQFNFDIVESDDLVVTSKSIDFDVTFLAPKL